MAQNDTLVAEPPGFDSSYVEDEFEDEEEKSGEYFEYKNDFDSLKVQQRKIPDSITKQMQQDEAFWYANTDIKKKKTKEIQVDPTYIPLGQKTWVKTLVWLIIIGGFAAAIMWYLANNNVGIFRRKVKAIQAVDELVETEDIFAINYQKEIDKATAQGNYRLAVRLMFLRLLKQMAEKNIINYKQGKTNFDYLVALQPTSYYKDFFRITRNYEYTWYGQFAIDEQAFRNIHSAFNMFERKLSAS